MGRSKPVDPFNSDSASSVEMPVNLFVCGYRELDRPKSASYGLKRIDVVDIQCKSMQEDVLWLRFVGTRILMRL